MGCERVMHMCCGKRGLGVHARLRVGQSVMRFPFASHFAEKESRRSCAEAEAVQGGWAGTGRGRGGGQSEEAQEGWQRGQRPGMTPRDHKRLPCPFVCEANDAVVGSLCRPSKGALLTLPSCTTVERATLMQGDYETQNPEPAP